MKNWMMQKKNVTALIVLLALLWVLNVARAEQSGLGTHPHLFTGSLTPVQLKAKLEKCDWKQHIVRQKTERLQPYLDSCKRNPDWLRSRLQMHWKTHHDKVFLHGGKFAYAKGSAPVPTVRFSGERDWATNYSAPKLEDIEPFFEDERGLFLTNRKTGKKEWVHPSETGHIIEGINAKILDLAADAAFLYWYTGNEQYAQLAAPVFDTYMQGMYFREAPVDLDHSNQERLSGLATFEVIHEGIVPSLALCYDFLYHYLNEKNYDLQKAVAVFQKWGDQIIRNGVPDNNWNFFQARFLTYIALVLDDDAAYLNGKGRQYYLDHTFRMSTERQIALNEAIRNYDPETGIWPECASYSMHVTKTLLEILTLLDGTTNADEFKNFPIVEKATLATFQYLFPNGDIVAFGDSRHQALPAESFEYLIANYRKYGKTDAEKQITALYKSLMENEKRGDGLFQLFFYVDELLPVKVHNKEQAIGNLTTSVFYAPNVSWVVQRMGSGNNAAMVSLAGAKGNHAHANGIALELFANNYVLAPEMGKGPSYWHEDHRNYYARYPAHNTVVVNGSSNSDAMRVNHPFVLEASYPAPGSKHDTFDQLTYSEVSFVEPTTLARQQRFTALVKSTSGKPYVVDIFRSQKPGEGKQWHDYFYHNLGQNLRFMSAEGEELKTQPSSLLVTPGALAAYKYFSNERSLETRKVVRGVFSLHEKDSQVETEVWLKGAANRRFFSVEGPESHALNKATAPKSMLKAQIPAMVIRQQGEAWTKPFVAVFNPFEENGQKAVERVDFPTASENQAAQFIEVVNPGGSVTDLITILESESDLCRTKDFYQKGLFSLLRLRNDSVAFIFAGGLNNWGRGNWQISSLAEPVNVSVEREGSQLVIQSSGPVIVSIPAEIHPGKLEWFSGTTLLEERTGAVNRNDAGRIDYHLERACERAIIHLGK